MRNKAGSIFFGNKYSQSNIVIVPAVNLRSRKNVEGRVEIKVRMQNKIWFLVERGMFQH